MKKSIILLVLVVVLGGCGTNTPIKPMKDVYQGGSFDVIEIDSCEYIHQFQNSWFTHKGNCKYCIERNRK